MAVSASEQPGWVGAQSRFCEGVGNEWPDKNCEVLKYMPFIGRLSSPYPTWFLETGEVWQNQPYDILLHLTFAVYVQLS